MNADGQNSADNDRKGALNSLYGYVQGPGTPPALRPLPGATGSTGSPEANGEAEST